MPPKPPPAQAAPVLSSKPSPMKRSSSRESMKPTTSRTQNHSNSRYPIPNAALHEEITAITQEELLRVTEVTSLLPIREIKIQL